MSDHPTNVNHTLSVSVAENAALEWADDGWFGRLRRNRLALVGTAGIALFLSVGLFAPLIEPYPGVADTIRKLHAGGINCLVVSNKGAAAIHQSIEERGLAPFIDLIFGDQPGLPKKPDRAILTNHILPHYARLTRDQMLVVGDTETDIVFAQAAGVASCAVATIRLRIGLKRASGAHRRSPHLGGRRKSGTAVGRGSLLAARPVGLVVSPSTRARSGYEPGQHVRVLGVPRGSA